jgi:hypothetical protein
MVIWTKSLSQRANAQVVHRHIGNRESVRTEVRDSESRETPNPDRE